MIQMWPNMYAQYERLANTMIGGVMMSKQRAVLTSMQGSSHGSVGRCSGAADGSLVRTRPHQGLLRTAVPKVSPRWEPGYVRCRTEWSCYLETLPSLSAWWCGEHTVSM